MTSFIRHTGIHFSPRRLRNILNGRGPLAPRSSGEGAPLELWIYLRIYFKVTYINVFLFSVVFFNQFFGQAV